MNILVCIKQVPENLEQIQINSKGNGIVIHENLKYRMNRFDSNAVEAALIIKENIPDSVVDVVTVGPDFSESIVRRAMGMGADNGFIIKIEPEKYVSPSTTSALLAKMAIPKNYNLILTGIMSEDEMNAQTGQMLAERMGIPSISGVVDIQINNSKLNIKREREGGIRELLEVNMSEIKTILLTIQAGINQPRYPSLSALLRAKNQEIKIFTNYLNTENYDNDQYIVSIKKAEKMRQGKYLEGSTHEKAKQFIDIMKARNILL